MKAKNKGVEFNSLCFDSRNRGIDLLRIVAMIMVVTHHFLGHGQVLSVVNELSLNWYITWFIKVSCYTSVTAFYLISAYYQSKKSTGLKSIIALWLQVLFYSILCYAIIVVFNFREFNIIDLIKAVFPVSFRQYGFFNGYLLMALLSPFFNIALSALKQKMHLRLIVILTFMCSVIPYITFVDAFNLMYGEGALWIALLYCIGAYFQKYIELQKYGAVNPMKWFLLLVFIQFSSKAIIANVTFLLWHEVKYSGAFIGETPILMLLATCALFVAFYNIDDKIKFYKTRRTIGSLSKLVFSVYLVSENNNIRTILWEQLNPAKYANSNIGILLLYWVWCIVVIFSFPMGMEWMRRKLFVSFMLESKAVSLLQKSKIRLMGLLTRKMDL